MKRKRKRAQLWKVLETEVAEWNQKPYAELVTLDYPIVYERRTGGDPESYQVEVELIQKNEQSVQIVVSVDDGGINAFFPPSCCVTIVGSRISR